MRDIIIFIPSNLECDISKKIAETLRIYQIQTTNNLQSATVILQPQKAELDFNDSLLTQGPEKMFPIDDIISLHRMLNSTEARIKIESKAKRTNQKQKMLHDEYAKAQIKQRKRMNNIIRTKHK